MFMEQRLEKIKKVLMERKKIDVASLCSILQVSDVTVRKDLDRLHKEGFLIKTHGGAVLAQETDKKIVQQIPIDNFNEKNYIAEMAFRTIEKDDSIFLGSGSTCFLLATKLKQLKDITVVTNNINALYELVPHVKNVFLIGGEITYREGMMSASWENTEEYFKGIYVNKAFTSVVGIDLVAGLTVNHAVNSYVFKSIPKITKEWCLIIDSTKFNKIGLYNVASIEMLNCVITDKVQDNYLKAFQDADVKVIHS